MIFIFGAPRSGTSWLAKIFDSHPQVLYRHEPDIVLRDTSIPFLCDEDQIEAHLDQARAYIERLLRVRQLKAAGSLPVFPKAYLMAPASWLRQGCIYAVRALEKAAGPGGWPSRIAIPDFVDFAADPSVRMVLKSVGSLGRAKLFATACPTARTIVILRHPCGHVASMLQGARLNKMERNVALSGLAETAPGRRRGLTEAKLAAMSPVEQLTWRWTIVNEMALEGLAGADNAKVLRYEDLCERPDEVSRELFAFADLSWHPQSAAFLGQSTVSSGRERYFSVRRDPLVAANKWRQDLDPEHVRTILEIVQDSAPGRLFA